MVVFNIFKISARIKFYNLTAYKFVVRILYFTILFFILHGTYIKPVQIKFGLTNIFVGYFKV